MARKNLLHPIPQPATKPLVGNLLSINADSPVLDMWRIAQALGGIYWLDMPGLPVIVVSDLALVDEICDEKRFDKSTRGALRRLRAASHGLFTSDTDEPTWSKPHNILLPNFSQRAMQAYHPMMLDIAEQLVDKWARLNSDDDVDVTRDMTALTLDTIGLCGFGYRFNSFYREDFHPFVNAMVRTLETVQDRRGLPLEELMMKKKLDQQREDVRYMHAKVEGIIAERRASGDAAQKADLLSYMIAGVDKKSGEQLDDRQIRDECIEFLIAGHETTSGMLSFALYFLLKHPDVLAQARAEVDSVLGTDLTQRPTYEQVNRLQYILQILKESLRMYPTAPAFVLRPKADTVIGGKYPVPKRSMVILHSTALHHNPAVWGDDADAFNPDHFSREAERTRPVNAFKPFGNGQRACIGRQFALQEAMLALGLIVQRFNLVDHETYQLKIKEALTLKPEGFRIRVTPRVHGSAQAPAPEPSVATSAAAAVPQPAQQPRHGTPLWVLHGSNLGSAEALARQLAESGALRGYAATLASLDDYAGALPTEGVVLIVTASYNGAAPDNAAESLRWLHDASGTPVAGVRYAVFGCGHTDWAATYQAVPREVDERLAALGAHRLHPRGEGDAREDLDGAFQAWGDTLWPALATALQLPDTASVPVTAAPLYTVELLPPAQPLLAATAHGTVSLTVLANHELQAQGSGRSTRHIELALPADAHYSVGEHLCVLPRHSDALVARVLQRLGLDGAQLLRLSAAADRQAPLPVGTVLSVHELLAAHVELQAVATRKHVAQLVAHTRCPFTQKALAALLDDDAHYRTAVLERRQSVLDLLEAYPAVELPLAALLEMLPPLALRYYSIASSPLVDATRAALTVGVVDGPARSGAGVFEGVCSHHLARAAVGSTVRGQLRSTQSQGFGLPIDPRTPLILIGPGTGIAPFRGFLQERATRMARGETLGPALLFFGCRHRAQDFLYADALQAWVDAGVVTLHTAFSRDGADKVYVQHRLQEQADAVWQLLQLRARVYVCGDGAHMEPAVRATLIAIAQARGEDGEAWMARMLAEQRYVRDVWAGD